MFPLTNNYKMDRNRLYLSKDNEVIYIDNCKLPHQHIDGIRFLYKQYKKNKPGVIINDPSQQSRNTQIVLFIKSICHLLNKPMLILCPHGMQYDWLRLLRTLNLGDDEVVIEIEKLYIKKKIFINFMQNLPLFTHREWSILVVADDDAPKELLQCYFNAQFKIWSTSVDMKDDLKTFSAIHNWLIHGRPNNQSDKFNINEFIPNKNSVRDIIDKAILVDAFMEDIVIRRKDLHGNLEEVNNTASNIISTKNKDATGTKIKRSKRKLQEAVNICRDNTDQQILPKVAKSTGIDKENSSKEVTTTKLELNHNIHIKEIDVTRPEIRINTDKVASQEMKLIYESDSIQKDDHEIDNLVTNTDVIKIENTDKNNCIEIGHKSDDSKCNEVNDINLYEVLQEKWKVAQVIIEDWEDVRMESADMLSYSKDNDDLLKSKENNTQSEDLNQIKTANDIGMNILSDTKAENNIVLDDSNTESELEKLLKSDNFPVNRKQVVTNVNDNAIKPATNKDASSSVFSDIDSINKRFMEEATKRFKGSVLDNIF